MPSLKESIFAGGWIHYSTVSPSIHFWDTAPEITVTYRFRSEHFRYQDLSEFPLKSRTDEISIQYISDKWVNLAVFMRF
jgi:hypothetical protein